MSLSYYLQSYQAASRRHAESYQELYGEDRWEEWVEEVGKIKAAWNHPSANSEKGSPSA